VSDRLSFVGGLGKSRADEVHQGLTNFSGAGSYHLALFILQNVDSASRIEGKNHRPRVHGFSGLLNLQ